MVEHWQGVGLADPESGVGLIRMIGAAELAAAGMVLVWPTRPLCLLIVGWKLFSETLFVTAGASVWEVVERGGSYGAPLALFVLLTRGAARTGSPVPLTLTAERQVAAPVVAGSGAGPLARESS
jgi:hypothetical protein